MHGRLDAESHEERFAQCARSQQEIFSDFPCSGLSRRAGESPGCEFDYIAGRELAVKVSFTTRGSRTSQPSIYLLQLGRYELCT